MIIPSLASTAFSLIISRIIDGPVGLGDVKVIEISNPTSEAVLFSDIFLTISNNGGSRRLTKYLQAPAGGATELLPGQRVAICSQAAKALEIDVDGSICLGDQGIVDSTYDFSVLQFNGNDQLTLGVHTFNGPVIQDVFGGEQTTQYTFCGIEKAAIDSILVRKAEIVSGSRSYSVDADCEWDITKIQASDLLPVLPPVLPVTPLEFQNQTSRFEIIDSACSQTGIDARFDSSQDDFRGFSFIDPRSQISDITNVVVATPQELTDLILDPRVELTSEVFLESEADKSAFRNWLNQFEAAQIKAGGVRVRSNLEGGDSEIERIEFCSEAEDRVYALQRLVFSD